ncbi:MULTISPECIES: sulfurtransferase-like selenium metabolism protein YedF [Mogibacterium]|uniref:Selenium metabolism protein YedF n=1 Tax=Mogibacterium timidum ATCC 33093 TaxID=1401079 RepID=X8J8B0_9FIRM|nr:MULTISPECIES: sulfurtransferase-like selenium metabolism protein YedF [Mogibacterium]EJU21966.1 selenium metabolism protein YedF [Mogibacterium sp. CM50]EUC59977.1 selenium metabolism protein YedF [Mogibacterium timidum ATCC 33093]
MRLDAAGKACPIPVIMAKKELDNGTQSLEIIVDGQTQIDNLERLGNTYGRPISTSPNGDKFLVSFADGDGKIPEAANSFKDDSYAVFFNKAAVGSGDAELGLNLAKMAIYTLSESENIPTYVLFMNDGVKLTTGIEPQIIDNLNTLIEKGAKVLVCGTCLNFFGIKDDCKIGTVSNMFDILGAMQAVSKVITL